MEAGHLVYQLTVTLLHSQPPIWWRFQVESAVTLQLFHRILQVVMGWTDSHMHGFRLSKPGRRGLGRGFLPIESADEKTTPLADLLRRPKDRLLYEYDFGDGWEHEVGLEMIVPSAPKVRYPMVLAGRGAGPPEDIGGLPGYYHFLEAIKDPKHPDHEEMVEWGREEFNPSHFDPQAVNRVFHGGWGPTRPGA